MVLLDTTDVKRKLYGKNEHFTIVQEGGDINTAWQCIVPPNLVFNITMLFVFARSDWDAIAEAVRDREEAEEAETLALLNKDNDDNTTVQPYTHYGSTTSSSRQMDV